jgi:glycopeptide antibiotics resistance protein
VLVLPFDWLIEDTRSELFFTCMWTGCLLIPFGYWARRITSHSGTGHRIFTASGLSLLAPLPFLAIGFAFLPHRFGLPAASLADLLSAAAGLLLGYGLAIRMGKQ